MQIKYNTDDLRICETKEVLVPSYVHEKFPMNEQVANTVITARNEIHEILSDQNDRLIVIVGPCSIHDVDAAKDYALKLKQIKINFLPT